MLILTRKEGEVIMIGDSVEVKILAVSRNGQVKIGIAAPPEIEVHRREIYERIQREREAGDDQRAPGGPHQD